MKTTPLSKLEITLTDIDQGVPKRARVYLRSLDDEDADTIRLRRDRKTGRYVAEVEPGDYELRATASKRESVSRKIRVSAERAAEFVVMAEPGAPFFYRGRAKVPFKASPARIGARILPGVDPKALRVELDRLAKRLRISLEDTTPTLEAERVRLFSTRLRLSSDRLDELIREIGEHEMIRDAGLAITSQGHTSILTPQIAARFKAEIKLEEIPKLAAKHGLRQVRAIPYAGNGWLLERQGPAGAGVLEACKQLAESGLVEYAEPNLIQVVEDLQLNPTDYLYPEQWHIGLVNLPLAWETLRNANPAGVSPGDADDISYGSAEIVLAILDRGIESTTPPGGAPTAAHPDFQGTVTDGANKVASFYDFSTMQANNDAPPNDHGMGCSSVAGARANNPSAVGGTNEGVVGAAPNCRLFGAIRPAGGTDQQYADAFIWLIGFNPGWSVDGVNYLMGTVFPGLNPTPADIISNSFGWSAGLSGVMSDMIDWVTSYGRGGRGTPLFWAAGNGNTTCTLGTATHPKVFAVAASSLANDGSTEIRASYSNFGNAIEFCAPSHDAYVGGGALHDPPTNYGVISADLLGQGNMPGAPVQRTTLSAAANAGDTSLSVADAAGFAAGQALLVGAPGAAGTEARMISAVPNPTTLTIDALLNDHAAGAEVAAGPANYRNNFGGTSSATPLAAGIAALCLSVNPALSWVELRQILRSTATQIDAANTNPTGQWVDTTGDGAVNFSQWYGWGRLDANAAVAAARDYDSDVDIVIRDNLGDTGTVPSPGWHAASPDAWVRQADDPIPALAYDAAPPHQNPKRGQPNYVFVRLANVGTADSSDICVRALISHFPGFEFRYPDEWRPSNLPGQPVPTPLVPGSYLIDEQNIPSLAAGANQIVKLTWPTDLIPPKTVVVGGMNVSWHPCLLVEASPHDGPLPTGTTFAVKDYNNLAHRNLHIDDADSDSDLAAGVVAGTSAPEGVDAVILDRSLLPPDYRVFIRSADERVMKRWVELARAAEFTAAAPLPGSVTVVGHDDDEPGQPEAPAGVASLADCGRGRDDCSVVILDEARVGLRCGAHGAVVVHAKPGTRLSFCCAGRRERPRVSVAKVQGREVIVFDASTRALELPLRMAGGQFQALAIGMLRPKGRRGRATLFATQRRGDGELSPGYSIEG